jgi:hypothetical protein
MTELNDLLNDIGINFRQLAEIHRKANTVLRLSTMLHNKEVQVIVNPCEANESQWNDGVLLNRIFKDIDLSSVALPYIRDHLAELHRELDAEFIAWKAKVM